MKFGEIAHEANDRKKLASKIITLNGCHSDTPSQVPCTPLVYLAILCISPYIAKMNDKKDQNHSVSQDHPVFLFDLDGTLVDSVYQHVLAWREAFESLGVHVSNWRIHRRIGMSDGLISKTLTREVGQTLETNETDKLREFHTKYYLERSKELRLLPGAKELLSLLEEKSVRHAIVTSSSLERAQHALKMLEIGSDVPVITLEQAAFGKPDPDLFLAAMKQLQVTPISCIIVGDSTWDILAARRAGVLAVGVLTGGYAKEELFRAGAYRVYNDAADLMENLDELGVHS